MQRFITHGAVTWNVREQTLLYELRYYAHLRSFAPIACSRLHVCFARQQQRVKLKPPVQIVHESFRIRSDTDTDAADTIMVRSLASFLRKRIS